MIRYDTIMTLRGYMFGISSLSIGDHTSYTVLHVSNLTFESKG